MKLYVVICTIMFLGALSFGGTSAAGDKKPDRFKVVSRRPDDRIDVSGDADKTTFSIKSPFGISKVDISRLEKDWPKATVIQLHLHGLESFKIATSKLELNGSVGLANGKPGVRLWKGSDEKATLDDKSLLWIATRIIDAQGKPAQQMPLKDGQYIEMTLPAPLFEGNPETLSVSWIDFYR